MQGVQGKRVGFCDVKWTLGSCFRAWLTYLSPLLSMMFMQ